MMTDLTECELDYLKKSIEELEDKMGDWLEADVTVLVYQTDEDSLANPEECYDEYVAVMTVDGLELGSFTDESPMDTIDLLSIWCIRHLIISCGSNNHKLELPDPARA